MRVLSVFTGVLAPLRCAIHWWVATSGVLRRTRRAGDARRPRSGYHSSMALHKEYLPDPLPCDPLGLVADWLSQAERANVQPNPNAMVLATVDSEGAPSARVVLCKEIQLDAGYLTFFTNYLSRKGTELAANARAAVVMYWDLLHRQVRLARSVVSTTPGRKDARFFSRIAP